jgi:hypothetical protein
LNVTTGRPVPISNSTVNCHAPATLAGAAAVTGTAAALPRADLARRGGGSRTGGVLFGLIVIIAGSLWLLHESGVARVDIGVALAVVLTTIGAVLVGTLGRASNGGLIALGIALTVILGGTMAIEVDPDTAFGDRVERPLAVGDIQSVYSHTLGSMTLDFSRLDLPVGTTETESSSSFGSVTIYVPSDVGVRVDAASSFGSVQAFGESADGIDTERVFFSPGYSEAERRLHIEVRSSFGSVEVIRR